MTDKAPERIWAEDFKPTPNGKLHTVAGNYHLNSRSVEYVRADLLDEAVKAFEALLALEDNTSPFGGEMQEDRIERTIEKAHAVIAKIKGVRK